MSLRPAESGTDLVHDCMLDYGAPQGLLVMALRMSHGNKHSCRMPSHTVQAQRWHCRSAPLLLDWALLEAEDGDVDTARELLRRALKV